MNSNIREVLYYDIDMDAWTVRHDVRVGYRQIGIDSKMLNNGQPLMAILEEVRKEHEHKLINKLSEDGLSISDAMPLPMPKGLTRPPWYTPINSGDSHAA